MQTFEEAVVEEVQTTREPTEVSQPIEEHMEAHGRKETKRFSYFRFKSKHDSATPDMSNPHHSRDGPGQTSVVSPSTRLSWLTFREAQHSPKLRTKWFTRSVKHRSGPTGSNSSSATSVQGTEAGTASSISSHNDGHLYRLSEDPLTPYPAGEARRVRTPPLHEDTADGKPRGFFGDVVAPGGGGDTWNPKQPHNVNAVMGKYRDRKGDKPREWWEAKKRVQAKKSSAPRNFRFDIPEHLPSSPMCPANPKHSSGGKGLCVYHGRKRKSSLSIEQSAEASHASLDDDA
ncbi:hypothetical protein CTRI78_v004519 [Colletotrichum trifolii]|uniref:Uncharacterized protein n=1 Tax=Colletotrichum trifolii TaxID=5466 RepID=A0A4V3HWG8_COLTR|nr:hypothetical protein CTRI78_v004519 [Colletotrichum trifolii]